MILSGDKIKQLIEEKKLIENADLNAIRSSSYDVSICDKILCFQKSKDVISL